MSIAAVTLFILLVYLSYRLWSAITGNSIVASANALDWLVCFLQLSHCLFQLSTTNFLPYLLDSDR
jgi:hypothetical protein